MLKLPLTDREIPVVADEYVDKEFGTGCVKITPAHDPNDFEVGKRHNLEEICIMNDDATINVPGKYFGMDRYEARKAMVEDLKEQGLLVKVVPHSHNCLLYTSRSRQRRRGPGPCTAFTSTSSTG